MQAEQTSETATERFKRAILSVVVPTTGELWPKHAGEYRCPICTRFFAADDLGALSLDHAPPRALGPRERVVVITCRECNSGAGSTVDDAMIDHEDLRDARAGRMTRPRESIVPSARGRIVTNTQVSPDGIAIMGVRHASNPEAFAAWLAEFEQAARAGDGKIRISGTFSPRRPQHWAEVGWLRSAYLIAYASGGYFYAFDGALDIVREQLDPAKRDTALIRNYGWRLQDADNLTGELAYIHEPRELRSIAVRVGDVLVLLPVMGDRNLYSRLAAESTDLRTLNLRTAPIPWPVPSTFGTATRTNAQN